MPLEIWILFMTFFNVFLVIIYLYYRTLHLNSKSKLEHTIENLEKRIDIFEKDMIKQIKGTESLKSNVLDDKVYNK